MDLEKIKAGISKKDPRFEEKLSELIIYSIYHTKNTKAQEEFCFIAGRGADRVFSNPSEQTTDVPLPILPISVPNMPTTTGTTTPTQVTSSHSFPHKHQSLHNHPRHNITPPPPLSTTRHTRSTMMCCTSNQDLVMISHHNIRGYHLHKAELHAFLEDNSPGVVRRKCTSTTRLTTQL